jgi:hypothetical protein
VRDGARRDPLERSRCAHAPTAPPGVNVHQFDRATLSTDRRFKPPQTTVLPPPGAHYAAVQSLVVALATPLLLLGADLRVVFEDTKRLTRAFAVGSAATAVGAVVGFAAAHSWLSSSGVAGALGPDDGYKVAAALAAKSIGGG